MSFKIGPLLQFVNDVPATTPTTRLGAKSLVWAFFREGEQKEDMICQLCPNHKVIRVKVQGSGSRSSGSRFQHGCSTSNMMRHIKRFHPRRFMEEQSKQAVREKLYYDDKMIMEERESADVFDIKDDKHEDELIDLISEPLV